ncbi:DUF2934 domain-containing protein [Methylotetracoccus oryzae]|uniref:DUF2934 domain-containing protein n=1 Tax=Methylotetracoccus oryzae TaxID=1919059 RepID=UPI00111B6B78|nr:DUF2934 domain-containing protein [Methylotetracoccus oryzae]
MSTLHTLARKARPISVEERQRMIAVAAYYLSEQRRASGDRHDPLDDWLTAERQIDASLGGWLIGESTPSFFDS